MISLSRRERPPTAVHFHDKRNAYTSTASFLLSIAYCTIALFSARSVAYHTRVVDLFRRMFDDARDVIRNTQTLPDWYADWAQEAKLRLENGAKRAAPGD